MNNIHMSSENIGGLKSHLDNESRALLQGMEEKFADSIAELQDTMRELDNMKAKYDEKLRVRVMVRCIFVGWRSC